MKLALGSPTLVRELEFLESRESESKGDSGAIEPVDPQHVCTIQEQIDNATVHIKVKIFVVFETLERTKKRKT